MTFLNRLSSAYYKKLKITMFYFLNSNVKYLRKKAGYTMPQLAKLLDITLSGLANFEGGQAGTTLKTLDKLHTIFEISLDDLVYKDLSEENN